MRDVVAALDRWDADGLPAAVATVVAVRRSAPRPPGAKMAVAADGSVCGMVSGGCVEGAVVQAADELLAGGPPRLLHFGIADAEAWNVGLPCGGEIDVWIDRHHGAAAARFADLARAGGRAALVTRLDDARRLFVGLDGDDGHATAGTLGDASLDALANTAARNLAHSGRCEQQRLAGVPVFVDVIAPPPRLIIVGAIDLAAHLAQVAAHAGWRAFVTDPRRRFTDPVRFPAAERTLAGWPAATVPALGGLDASSALVALTHDPKIDDAGLDLALRSDAGFIGALGSRRLQADRRARLLALGHTTDTLDARLSGPVGLDLGAVTPQETALSIMAEVVAARHRRAGGRLRDSTADRIHDIAAT